MDKLKSLMIFMRSAQYGSFSEAARQLGMALSAVSRAVLRLEDELHVRLLQRTTCSLTLTEDGNRFYQRCQQILNDLEEAELEIKQSQSIPIGTLRLDLSFTFGKLHIAPALLQFAARYPELNLNVSFNDRLIDLIEEGIDATVRIGVSSDSSLIMRHLATAHYIACASPQYLAQYGTPTRVAELLQHRCVNFIFPQTRRESNWKFEQDGKAIDPAADSSLQFDNSEVILEAAIQGAGVVQLPKFIAAKAARGDLQQLLQSKNDLGVKLMQEWWEKNFSKCELGDLRSSKRAREIGKAPSLGLGKAMSEVFSKANTLRRAYEFLPTRELILAR